MTTGLRPRDFTWVMKGRLAVSSRIGGHGFEHRPVRRREEIAWLRENGFTAVVSLLPSVHNIEVYKEAGMKAEHAPVKAEYDREAVFRVFPVLDRALTDPAARVLVHKDMVDGTMAGMLAGYIKHAGLVEDEMTAARVIEGILGRPLGPDERGLIPPDAPDD